MAVTILNPHPETYTNYIIPKATGLEDRDIRAYPLPPNTNMALINAVMDELRAQGHVVSARWKRERLANWTKTNQANDRSFCADEGWQPNPKGPTLIHFVEGGWDGIVTVDGVEHRLEAQHLRMPRAVLATWLRGRP